MFRMGFFREGFRHLGIPYPIRLRDIYAVDQYRTSPAGCKRDLLSVAANLEQAMGQ